MSTLKIPHKEPYEPWTFIEAEWLFEKNNKDYNSVVAQSWLLKPETGESRLPKPLTIEHFIKKIVDIVFLLNKVKGNEHDFH